MLPTTESDYYFDQAVVFITLERVITIENSRWKITHVRN